MSDATRSGAAEGVEIAAAVNDRSVLANCLQRSPDIASGTLQLRTYEGYSTAGTAYERALAETTAPYLVLAHQDVYLPAGFAGLIAEQITEISRIDPNWAAAGVIGIDASGAVQGQTWSSGLGKLVGAKVAQPVPVETLDEVLLVVRRDSGIHFDPELPSFHLYAADFVQTAKAQGLNCYAVDLPIVHHSRPVVELSGGYRKAYIYMQRKWRRRLPLPNLVCVIHRSPLPLLRRDLSMRLRARGKTERLEATGDPVLIARRLGLEEAV
jgi:hypothetical protein